MLCAPRLTLAMLALVLAILPAAVPAQPFPSKTVRLVLPFPPGGPTDLLGRSIAQKLSEQMGQQVLPDNRPGAGGNLGLELASKSPPDGYTIVLSSSLFALAPALYAKLNYQQKDLAPISLVAEIRNVLLVHPSVPAKSVKELVALAKSRQGKFHFASGGVGTGLHMAGELLNLAAGIRMIHVPYKGAAPSMTALMSGEVDTMFNGVSSALPHVKAGRLRALAVSSAQRSPLFPELPTVAESGYQYETAGWYGLVAPARTPKAVTAKLQSNLHAALNTPQMKERLAAQGVDGIASTPEGLSQHLRRELDKWTAVVKSAGLRAD